jgi:UDP-N-acetylglucosamine--N-acetylmuramyl-(pentapeptide) pyrophosphoryl-undecaprenol N-acetylglucosamine transferase
MKRILLTGGGTGGHIMPLIAVADELKKTNYADIEIYYIGPKSPWMGEFEGRDIPVYRIAESKLRRYFSLANIIDIPKFFFSILESLFRLYFLMPDVVFSKGGPGALAVVLAAKFYMIPIIIHESDSAPGLTNKISAKFAKRIGLAFESAAGYFDPKKTFLSGNPVRSELIGESSGNAAFKSELGFNKNESFIFVWGGSQGAARINRFIFENLETFLRKYQIFHQVGESNFKEAQAIVENLLKDFPEEDRRRYRLTSFLDVHGVRAVLSAADMVLARASAGSIFEISLFGKPSILIPLEGSAGDHQRLNAYEYAKTGAAIVIEEANLTPNIVSSQIESVLEDKNKAAMMSAAAKKFAKPEAASVIAQEIIKLANLAG